MSETGRTEEIVEIVRDRYGRIAQGLESGCCGPAGGCGGGEAAVALGVGYTKQDLASLPEEANLGLGCGAPLRYLALAAGETVLDLGSGAGVDAFLAAREVGPTGRVIGVDMTPAMLDKARANVRKAGVDNVEFREGRLESLPVEASSVDAVTSNCVINLVPDKGAVFAEVAQRRAAPEAEVGLLGQGRKVLRAVADAEGDRALPSGAPALRPAAAALLALRDAAVPLPHDLDDLLGVAHRSSSVSTCARVPLAPRVGSIFRSGRRSAPACRRSRRSR